VASRFGSPAYAERRHFLTRAGAAWLAGHDAALVGIDALNIDDTADDCSSGGVPSSLPWLATVGS
jgi:hypothetical protein